MVLCFATTGNEYICSVVMSAVENQTRKGDGQERLHREAALVCRPGRLLRSSHEALWGKSFLERRNSAKALRQEEKQ